MNRGRWARTALATGLVFVFSMATVQCSSTSDSAGSGGFANGSGNGGSGNGSGNGGSGNGSGGSIIDSGVTPTDANYSADAFFAEDPPPADCSDSGAQPMKPGGTPECPDDKNYKGCPCPTLGATAPCWPGKRKNRNKGLCKDGVTTCESTGELSLAWGECVGYQGISPPTFEPPPGATGKAACTCFSGGYWDVKNTSPCFYTSGSTVTGGVSTILDASGARCPTTQEMNFSTGTPPAQPFSPNTLKVDCNGYFKLCYTLKALSAQGAQKSSATDCAVTQVCTEAYYGMAGKGPNGTDGVQDMPDLPGWITKTSAETACAAQFYANGGYGEFSVDGTSDECDKVQKIFMTFDYCPFKCNDPANKNDPECVNCSNGSGAPF